MIWFFALSGCIENGFTSRRQDSVAATYGDFDLLTESLDRQLVQHGIYEGLISNATWTDRDISGIPVEALFFEGEMGKHDAVLVASGTRGLGRTEYNSNRPDDLLIGDEQNLRMIRNFLQAGKSFFLTDWAYDLAEQGWPEYIEFYGDDATFDAAQVGAIGQIVARVTDPELEEALGMSSVLVEYNFSNWAVIEDVGPDTRVWLRGDVSAWNGEAYEELRDVPLLVSFQPAGGDGVVAVQTFHANAQTPAVTDILLEATIGPLPTVREDAGDTP